MNCISKTFTLGSEGISYLPGAYAVRVQETTKKKYVSRWACTLTVRSDGSMSISDGTPHGSRPTGLLKVDGNNVESSEITTENVVTLSDKFKLDTADFLKSLSGNRPLTVVDADRRRAFISLKDTESRFNLWDKVDMFASRLQFMALGPIAISAIRSDIVNLHTLGVSILIFAVFLAIHLLAAYMKARYMDMYRCPHCHKKLNSGNKLRSWEDLREDNECPRCHKFFDTDYDFPE